MVLALLLAQPTPCWGLDKVLGLPKGTGTKNLELQGIGRSRGLMRNALLEVDSLHVLSVSLHLDCTYGITGSISKIRSWRND